TRLGVPDPLRFVLLLLCLTLVLVAGVLIVGSLRWSPRASLLALWILATGQIVALTEVLSLLHAVDWPGYVIGQLAATGAGWLMVGRRVGPELRSLASRWRMAGSRLLGVATDCRQPALPLLAGACALVALLSTVLALWVPPNSWDGLAYHMSRVGFYLQFHSL